MYRMHEGVGGCEGPRVIWAADLPIMKLVLCTINIFVFIYFTIKLQCLQAKLIAHPCTKECQEEKILKSPRNCMLL